MRIAISNLQFLILVALLATTAALYKEPSRSEIKSMSSQIQQGEPKIIGGEDAPLHRFPYQVALPAGCSWHNGALITDRWVITTAYVANALPSENAIALLGAHEPNITEVTQQRIEIDKKITHESSAGPFVNDIALLRLKTAAVLDRFVSTITLAAFNAPDFDGAQLRLTSFGFPSNSTSTGSQILRYIVLNGISNSVCKRMREEVNDGNICVETTGGKGGCHFDNGAPLVDVESGLLVGLMGSYGYWVCAGSVLPSFFTRVSYHNKWITDNIENNTNIIK